MIMNSSSSFPDMWTCTKCTFVNETNQKICEMCHTSNVNFGTLHNKNKEEKEVITIDLTKALSPCPSMESAKRKKQKRKLQEDIPMKGNDDSSVLDLTSSSQEKDGSEAKRSKLSLMKWNSGNNPDKRQKSIDSTQKKLHNNCPDKREKNISSLTLTNKVGKKVSNPKTMTQTTLFGTIVKNIQNTDLKNCSKQSIVKKKDKVEPAPKKPDSGRNNIEPVNFNREEDSKCTSQKIKNKKSKLFIEARYHAMKARQDEVMKTTFKIESLRNLQPKAVDCALKQKNQIIIMATGGGKSLCYQLPAALMPGITIVISPLIALMIDQVQSLREKKIEAASICSANGQRANMAVMQRLVGKNEKNDAKKNNQDQTSINQKPLKLLYCTPESIKTNKFRAILSNLYQQDQLSLFAIDEAHCLSTWGHDFRPAYRELHWIRTAFPDVPCMACTATATPKVVADIRGKIFKYRIFYFFLNIIYIMHLRQIQSYSHYFKMFSSLEGMFLVI